MSTDPSLNYTLYGYKNFVKIVPDRESTIPKIVARLSANMYPIISLAKPTSWKQKVFLRNALVQFARGGQADPLAIFKKRDVNALGSALLHRARPVVIDRINLITKESFQFLEEALARVMFVVIERGGISIDEREDIPVDDRRSFLGTARLPFEKVRVPRIDEQTTEVDDALTKGRKTSVMRMDDVLMGRRRNTPMTNKEINAKLARLVNSVSGRLVVLIDRSEQALSRAEGAMRSARPRRRLITIDAPMPDANRVGSLFEIKLFREVFHRAPPAFINSVTLGAKLAKDAILVVDNAQRLEFFDLSFLWSDYARPTILIVRDMFDFYRSYESLDDSDLGRMYFVDLCDQGWLESNGSMIVE